MTYISLFCDVNISIHVIFLLIEIHDPIEIILLFPVFYFLTSIPKKKELKIIFTNENFVLSISWRQIVSLVVWNCQPDQCRAENRAKEGNSKGKKVRLKMDAL